jgi:hypothetical protein
MKIIKPESGFSPLVILVSASLACSAADGQVSRQSPPRFEDYRINAIYKAVPAAAPKIITPAQRKYRTRIREGVEKAWGVFQNSFGNGEEQHRPGPKLCGEDDRYAMGMRFSVPHDGDG